MKLTLDDPNLVVCTTTAKIMQTDYPEIWERVIQFESALRKQQETIIALLPDAHKKLPIDTKQLQELEEQNHFLYYILLRSIYMLCFKVWNQMHDYCEHLAKGELDDESIVTDFLNQMESVDFESLLSKEIGLALLKEIRNIAGDFYPVLMQGKATWSLGDIIGTIETSGFTYEGLLESAQTTPIIQNTNIGYIKEINV
jgi:hypothetical protein